MQSNGAGLKSLFRSRPFKALLALCSGLLVFNEIRGLILAGPVIYALYLSGGTLTAIWVAFCSLAGIALSVAVPAYLARRLRRPA